MSIRMSEDRPVKAFGPDGLLRRQRFTQANAQRLVDLKVVIAQWDRRKLRIICIHFYGESRIPVRNRLRAGTRYSYREAVADSGARTWTHQTLPYRAAHIQHEYLADPQVIDSTIRAIFCAVPLSISRTFLVLAAQPKQEKSAKVVAIDSVRRGTPRQSIPEALAA